MSYGAIPQLIARSRPASVQMTVAPDPGLLAVYLDDAKLQCRISTDDEDSLILSYLQAAIEYVQGYQWSQLLTATFVQRQDFFPPALTAIELYRNPNATVTSLTYIDTAGNTQTLVQGTDFTVDNYIVPALVLPQYTHYWPAARWYVNDVTVTYTAGYGAPADVPAATKQAIMLLVSQWYWNREAAGAEMSEAPFAVKALLDLNSYRRFY